ncbi:MAG: glycosyltransferase [Geobacter sp.]|nr:glycosyltransferase [Geobacter sp.]
MNILVTNVPAVYRIDLYERLGRSGWKIFFYARNAPEFAYCSDKRELSFPFEDVSLPFIFLRLVLLQPKVVVCINASPFTLLCGIYSWLFRRRFVIWWAGTDLSEERAGLLKRIFRRFVFRLADGFLTYSEFASAYLAKMGVNHKKITLLGNMTFEPAKFRALVDQERAKHISHPLTLLSIANLVERKNHSFLLIIFSELCKKFPDLRLVIAGEGPERLRLERMIRELKLAKVELRGHVNREEVPALLAEADIFMHPAIMDQWPQAINEAMAAGIPIIVSRQSGISETLFTNCENVVICELSVESFVNAATILLQVSAHRVNFSAESQAKLVELFNRSLITISNGC